MKGFNWLKDDIGHKHLIFYTVVAIIASVITTIIMNTFIFFPMLLNSAFQ